MRFFSVLWNGEDYPSDLLCNCCQNKSITFQMKFLFNMNECCISMHIYILVKRIWRGVQTTPSPCKVQTSLNLHYKYQKYASEPPPPRETQITVGHPPPRQIFWICACLSLFLTTIKAFESSIAY